jgi:hypothetical protein
MNTLWVLLALWMGTMAGFLLFALMAMARDGERSEREAFAHDMRRVARARVRATMTRGA